MHEHKKGAYRLLKNWHNMDERKRTILLNVLEEEKRMIESGKDDLVRLIERTKELRT